MALTIMEGEEEKGKNLFRMDCIQEPVITLDGEKAYLEFRLVPDSKRYHTIVEDDGEWYHDKYTNTRFPKHLVQQMLKEASGAPPFQNPPKEDDAKKYLIERRKELREHWHEKYRPAVRASELTSIFEGLRGKDVRMVVLYVDMEGSTRLSSQLPPDVNAKVVKTFIMQMALIIDNYGGYVLKTVGDAIIAIWIAENNFTTMCDNSIQAAMTIRRMVDDVLNPLFRDSGIPEIGFHIGIDIGTVRVDNVGASDVLVADDLIGYTMNRAAKIQAKAGHNEILMGRLLFDLLHNSWQQYGRKKKMDDSWTLPDPERKVVYEVYEYGGQWDINLDSKI